MMQAGINNAGRFRSTLSGFRRDAKAHHNCGLQSDYGWPRDLGFARCLQQHFNATFQQSNVFFKCLDLSEGVMVESLQTAYSSAFLGAYNYNAMLMACMAVITAFLIFTAGGAWSSGLKESVTHHISGTWRPLSAFNVNSALLWSMLLTASSFFYTFPLNGMWSAIPAVNDRRAFPATPWGGYFCCLVFLSMTGFFFAYFLEWVGSKGEPTYDAKKSATSYSIIQPGKNTKGQKLLQITNGSVHHLVWAPNVYTPCYGV
jgi:hypothetical protein